MDKTQKTWFDKYQLNDITLKNRLVMAPLARMRCDESGIPNELVKKYYLQRAGFGMIITECSPISVRGNANIGAGGIYTEEQVQGWKNIIDAVHKENCAMCIQLWHCGRVITQGFYKDKDMEPWGPSPIQLRGANHQMPHEMTKEEIKIVIQEFKQAAINAKKAGFDFVQLHGANGFLVDQFLRDGSNQRKDEYGGSAENRCRFALEAIDALIEVYGKERVCMRVSPTGRLHDMFDSDPLSVYSYLFKKLDEKGIAFVEIKEAGKPANFDFENEFQSKLPKPHDQMLDCCKSLKPFFSRTVINNDGFTAETGIKKINEGDCDLISFGRLAIANPDLPNRFLNNYPMNQARPEYYFTGGENGYTDYPFYGDEQKNK